MDDTSAPPSFLPGSGSRAVPSAPLFVVPAAVAESLDELDRIGASVDATLPEPLPVAILAAGDTVWLPVLGPRVVSSVVLQDDGLVRVSYFNRVEFNRDGTQDRLHELGLRPLSAFDTWPAAKGDPERARVLREKLEQDEAARFARKARDAVR